MLKWQKSYSVNITRIDLQHRKVLALISRLYSLEDHRPSVIEMKGWFQELRDFIQTHFRDEEALMLRCDYPGYDEQKRDHDTLMDLLSDHQRDYLTNRPAANIDRFASLWNRFALHITQLDKKYVPFMRSKGLG